MRVTTFVFILFLVCSGNTVSPETRKLLKRKKKNDQNRLIYTGYNPSSRYALCLSGEFRTFEHTIPRYIQLLDSNKKEGIDVFIYASNELGNELYHSKKLKDFLFKRPEVKIKRIMNTTSATVVPPAVMQAMSVCKSDDETLKSALLQANKILKCQHLIDDYVLKHRHGKEYELIIRSRPDILLPPQPLKLKKIEDIVRSTIEKQVSRAPANGTDIGNVSGLSFDHINKRMRKYVMNDGPSSLLPSLMQQASHFNQKSNNMIDDSTISMNGKEEVGEKRSIRSSDKQTLSLPIRAADFLFVPMCCDWEGLNDQFAIGTSGAMRAYAQRLYTWHPNYPQGCAKESEVHTLLNVLSRLKYTQVFRFVYQYTLLRDFQVSHLEADPLHYVGSHRIVSAGGNGLDRMVGLDTVCAHDYSDIKAEDIPRQIQSSGKSSWTSTELKCRYEKRDQPRGRGATPKLSESRGKTQWKLIASSSSSSL